MSDIEIKRGYEVLPDNSVKFGIRIINNSDSAISDVEVILDYTESLFNLEGNKIQKLGNIPPTIARTANFVLKPLGCVHKENVGATVLYKDHTWEKHVESMRPKEVHCVCPFLKEMSITRSKFLELSTAGHSAEAGINFEGVTVDQLSSFLMQTCTNRLYKVDEYSIEGGRILYLASESIGEKAYYLLTAIIKDNEGLTQVMLRAVSDKSHGLNGFINEITADLRHVVNTVHSAHEIGVIRKEQVINIIDSVVQRSSFGGVGGGASVNIQDSVVQRTEFNAGEDRGVEEDRLRKKQEIDAKEKQKARDEQERIARQKSKTRTNMFMLAIVLGALLVGYTMYILDFANTLSSPQAEIVPESIEPISSPQSEVVPELIESTPPSQSEVEPEVSQPFVPLSNQKTRTNSIGIEFVLIPAGQFKMGSPSDEEDRDASEGPLHTVKIEKAYYLGKYEVTQKQWREVMGDNPSDFKGDDRPVECVSWDDAQEFIKKLNTKEGTDKYRLPSEAEWEYAARAGTTTQYSFGDDVSKIGEYVWYFDNSDLQTHPVGQKKPNSWGLYDMHGNVWEWVQDEWHDNYDGAPTDGSAWDGGAGSSRVGRGGSWYNFGCRSAFRYYDVPSFRYRSLGFRLLQEP